MRILHVTDASSSGVLTAVTTLARTQSAIPGCQVAFAYTPRTDSPPIADIRALTGPRVRVLRLTGTPRLAVPALAVGLTHLLRRSSADVIHVHSSRAGMVGRAVAAATGNRGRTVYSPHCFAFDRAHGSRAKATVFRALERLGTRLGPRLALCSASEQQLARSVLPGARTAVLANAVDTAALAGIPAAERGEAPAARASGAPLRIIHVGRIAAQKRPDVFGEIARNWPIMDAGPAHFTWLGEGDRSLLPPQVEVSGWLDPDALHRALARADLMLFTSAGEGMPIALLEAQAMGIPVVGHPVTGVVDIVEHGRTGLLATGTDDLTTALGDLAHAPARRQELGAAAARRMATHFDIADLGARSLRVYAALGIDTQEETR